MLIKGKAKDLLEDSINNALLAVEIYNKPKLENRIKSYIVHMNIAWTKAFHAYFHKTIGEKYFYKDSSGKYQRIDGEKRTWKLKTCMDKYKKLNNAVYMNNIFFIKLRNKIEHSYLNCTDLEIKIFGECQSLLYNYENFIIENFGQEYSINVSLPFSLQFSELRNEKSYKSSKLLLSKEMSKINEFIDKFRDSLSTEIYSMQEYSIKLVQIPIISNTNKGDLAIQFLNWDKLTEDEKQEVERLTALVKNKTVIKSITNADKMLPGKINNKVKEKYPKFNLNIHSYLTYIFSIKPSKKLEPTKDPFDTNTKYCYYDQTHKDYQYTNEWLKFIEKLFEENKLSIETIKELYKNKCKLEIQEFE